MSIDNTQWANYEHRQAFDQILKALRPYGYTDESHQDDAGPKLSLLGHPYHEHDIYLLVGGEGSNEFCFYLSQDHEFLSALGCGHHHTFYAGDDIDEVIRIAKLIAPAQETYTQLLKAGYRITNTGGGCTAWYKDFGPDYRVMVTADGQANLIEMDLESESVQVDELLSIGVYHDGAPIWGAGADDESMSWVRVGDHRGLAGSLEVAEIVAREDRASQIDLMSGLGDWYGEFLQKHFPMGDMFCADDLMAEHSHEMSDEQRNALQAFIDLWELVETMEAKK